MSIRYLLVFVLALTACAKPSPKPAAGSVAAKFEYPLAARGNQLDIYHGVSVADPYRWLENTDAPETRTWIDAENRITQDFLQAVPERQRIQQRLSELWDYERFSAPIQENGQYFYLRNSGLQNQSVLFTTKSLNQEAKILLDPNTLSPDGTIALQGMVPSRDGKWLAYGLATAGSDWNEWKIRNVETGQDLPETLRFIKFSEVSWTPDHQGFYYSRFPEPKPGEQLEQANYYNKVYYHKIQTSQEQDQLIYERADQKEWGFEAVVSEDGLYLVIHVTKGTDAKNMVIYKSLRDRRAPFVELVNNFSAEYLFLGNNKGLFWFKTNLDAPRGRVVIIDTQTKKITEVIPQSSAAIDSASWVGDRLMVNYIQDVHSQIKLFDLHGKEQGEILLPGIGSAWGFDGKRSSQDTFYAFSGWAQPTEIFRFDLKSGKSTLWQQPKVKFNPADYETIQVFATSKDGTRIPIFVTGKKGFSKNGQNPTYLYGYGGFNISLTPWFSVTPLVWMEMGGLFAVANIRGGGEYGEQWHEAGKKQFKQNVFDDFVAAAEFLSAEKYTSKEKLAIGGGSNGGLLVGASITERPDLFGAAVAQVGVMDMLRFHKFTIGWSWVDDYGSSDNADDFKALYAYSPLHNVKARQKYPATLLTTGDHDDRVVPAHSFKFAAALQAAQAGEAPILIRIETRAGHGAGKPTNKMIEEAADRWAFLVRVLQMKVTI